MRAKPQPGGPPSPYLRSRRLQAGVSGSRKVERPPNAGGRRRDGVESLPRARPWVPCRKESPLSRGCSFSIPIRALRCHGPQELMCRLLSFSQEQRHPYTCPFAMWGQERISGSRWHRPQQQQLIPLASPPGSSLAASSSPTQIRRGQRQHWAHSPCPVGPLLQESGLRQKFVFFPWLLKPQA